MTKIKILKIKYSHLSSFVNLWNQDDKILTSGGWEMTEEKAKRRFNKKSFDYFDAFEDKNLVGFVLLKKTLKFVG